MISIHEIHPMPNSKAMAAYAAATDYLKNSDLAKTIIGDLEGATENITIKIGTELENKYIHSKDNVSGGIVEWNPSATLDVIDKARYRPCCPWVPNPRATK